jgi:benzoate/toluate 1,2-dioxygenase reductase subunit
MRYQIALNFEDGVTRFIECGPEETVADASYRARINVPMDCRDGVCGTCKGFCESGQYDGGDYIEDALTDEEAEEGYVLTCQMRPKSNCVIRIAATSDVCKTGVVAHSGRICAIERPSDTIVGFSVALDNREALSFLPGQYVNVLVPGTDQKRSYSFSSAPHVPEVSFVLRNITTSVLPNFLRTEGALGSPIEFTGPFGSFYLRQIKRPLLLLAGGTGIAPFLAMVEAAVNYGGSGVPVHLIYGVNTDADLVAIDKLEHGAKQLPNFTFSCCVVDEQSKQPRKGYVTRYIEPRHLNGGDVDVYLCGPPPMVDAVRKYFSDQGIEPANFYFEKFSSTGRVVAISEAHAGGREIGL